MADETKDDGVIEIDNQKYIEVKDGYVPVFETIEELYKYIDQHKDRETH